MCKSESIKVYEVTKETAEKLKLDSEKRNKLNIEINITTAKNSFEIKSDKYVPFSDLKIEQQYLKHLIKKEINELCKKNKGDNKILLASYQGKVPKNADIENMLFYNIGTGILAKFFSGQTTQRLAFWRKSSQDDKHNTYNYEIADAPADDKLPEEITNIFKPKKSAGWENISINSKTLPEKPDEYYSALRLNKDKVKIIPPGSNGYEEAFGLKITLTVPKSNKSSHPASVMKHFLDGVICAFHGEDGKAENAVKERFKKDELFKQLLKDSDKLNVLGKREYLKQNTGWNPADEADRLKFAYIIVKREGAEYKMSGEIYKWE